MVSNFCENIRKNLKIPAILTSLLPVSRKISQVSRFLANSSDSEAHLRVDIPLLFNLSCLTSLLPVSRKILPIPGKIFRFPEEFSFTLETALLRVDIPCLFNLSRTNYVLSHLRFFLWSWSRRRCCHPQRGMTSLWCQLEMSDLSVGQIYSSLWFQESYKGLIIIRTRFRGSDPCLKSPLRYL